MRQVVLDTETTGLSWEKGNRVVEIGCIELLERRPTGRRFQRHLNPCRDMEAGAQEVTGLTREFLSDKPLFAQVCDEFLDFVRGAELVIHNADFDVGFLDYELSLLGAHYGRLTDHAAVVDTLALARERYPGQRNSLDALCRRLGVDNGHRKLHGALLDAELLAEVYLAMTSGQGDLGLAPTVEAPAVAFAEPGHAPVAAQRRVLRASTLELDAHLARLAKIAKKAGGRTLWPAEDEAADEATGAPVALRG
jgi:DNA polymerase-3 subunit epsilon